MQLARVHTEGRRSATQRLSLKWTPCCPTLAASKLLRTFKTPKTSSHVTPPPCFVFCYDVVFISQLFSQPRALVLHSLLLQVLTRALPERPAALAWVGQARRSGAFRVQNCPTKDSFGVRTSSDVLQGRCAVHKPRGVWRHQERQKAGSQQGDHLPALSGQVLQ